jgi:uncharacterized membrane protein YgdD (TMEM256/DUF423 family)
MTQVNESGWRGLALAAALLGLGAVLLGALGSHVVDLNDAQARHRWNIALQIHYFQAAALMALAALTATTVAGRKLFLAGWLQVSGTLVFCGSLYLGAAGIGGLPGWITPAGGLVLILGWAALVVTLFISRPGRAGPAASGSLPDVGRP